MTEARADTAQAPSSRERGRLERYPQQWEADVVLADGGVAHVRPATRADADADPRDARPGERQIALPAVLLGGQAGLRRAGGGVHRRRSRHGDRAGGGPGRRDHRGRHRAPQHRPGRPGLGRGGVPGGGLPAGPRARLDPAGTPGGRGAGTGDPPVHRRGTGGEQPRWCGCSSTPGTSVQREYDSGVIDLVFDIAPTDKSRAVVLSREHRAEARSIARLVSPRSIAVIGASADPIQDRARRPGEPAPRRTSPGRSTRSIPEAVSVRGVRAYRPSTTSPIRSTSRWSPCRPRRSPTWWSPAGSRACTAWW